ncbi:MAG: hypothetical protein GY816_17615 [Cytophagales bacterium]|nr:hypothetical protein [Cytophagales bacterium]
MAEEEKLTGTQLTIIREMLNDTLNQAATSMGDMLRVRMKVELLGFGDRPFDAITEFDSLGRFRVHVVKVALKGQIGGAFYFLINGHEVELINSVSLPQVISPGTNSQNRQMKKGFMTEIENMIAALSIAEISDFLGIELLGGVPETIIMEGGLINDYLIDEMVDNKTAFHVTSLLSGVAVRIAPYFVWMLDENFIRTLKLNT